MSRCFLPPRFFLSAILSAVLPCLLLASVGDRALAALPGRATTSSCADRPSPAAADGGSGQPIEMTPFSPQMGELPKASVRIAAPGTDTTLCMSWEPTIAVDPNAPNILAVAQFLTVQVSFDGGTTFPNSATVTAPGNNPGGDPALAFDSQGRLFISYLCNASGGNRSVCISGYSCNAGSSSCSLLPGAWPVDVSAASGVVGNDDKNWMAADARASSPFRDRLYVIWTRLSSNPWSVRVSSSADQGQTWSPVTTLSGAGAGNYWPSTVAVGPTGRVFAAWHYQSGFLDPSGGDVPDGISGQTELRRSDDGGATWLPQTLPYTAGNADASFNVRHEANGLIGGAPMWLFGSVQPWVLPDPANGQIVHVVAADDPDNNVDAGDASDIFIVTSNDAGATWGARRRVDKGPAGTFQVMPTAAINPVNGTIGVAWYDNRAQQDSNVDGFFELDFLATFSTDGGVTWANEVDFNDGRMDPASANTCRFCGSDAITNQTCGTVACPNPGTTRVGEYNGIAFGECTLYAAWADNVGPGCGGDYDTWFDRDPALGGDVTAPALACPANIEIACTSSTAPAVTGTATTTDNCDLDPVLSFSDADVAGNCPIGKIRKRIDRTWKSIDAAGNQKTCVQRIDLRDDQPPVLTLPAPLALECNSSGGVPVGDPQVVAWRATFSASDACGTAALSDNTPALLPSGCPPGGKITAVTFTATDDCGNSASAPVNVTVKDTTPPVVMVPAPLALECNSKGGVLKTDPAVQAWLALATAVDVCSAANLANDAPALLPSGCPPAGGNTTVTFTGSDSCGNLKAEASSVKVTDSTPPTVDCAVTLNSLWPPNNKLIDVGLSVTTSDICDVDPPTVTITVTSDESPLGGNHCPDAVIGPGNMVQIRAQRDGSGDGRVYRIRVQAQDSCANAALCTADVTVRHDANGPPAVDSGQLYDATICD